MSTEKQLPKKTHSSTTSRKFFTSKNNSSEKTVLSSNVNINIKRDESKPPIVLRICRGKSQLLSDSDESESTPTPSSTPSTSTITSPRAKDNVQRSPGNIRITRSARRSMQQDPSSSPATADTPADTFASLFTSPKKQDLDLSPQYIPAEKYELERKAVYDSLLKPDSPKEPATSTENTDTNEISFEMNQDTKLDDEYDEHINENNNKVSEGYAELESKSCTESLEEEKNEEECEEIPELMDTSTITETEDQRQLEQAEDLLKETYIDFNSSINKALENPTKKQKVVEDWSTDSDSDSAPPETDRKQSEKNVEKAKTFPLEKHKEEILDKILEKPSSEPLAPVKLVISKKKGSIFKSRSMVTDGGRKRRALYKHKWSDDSKDTQQKGNEEGKPEGTSIYDEYGFSNEPLTRVTTEYGDEDSSEVVTSIKCTKSDKGVSILFIIINCLFIS